MAGRKIKVAENQIGFDFDVPVGAGPKRGRVAKPMSELDLSERPQTRLKLLSLGEYLPVWFAKISNLGDEAYYLDFFAGPGAYVDGVASAKGSPILACEAAAGVVEMQARRGRTWTPQLRFVEPDAATRATLAAELARFDGIVDYRIVAKTAEAALAELVAESAGSPTLAFFDPFGYDIDFEMVTAFSRDGINEVLVSFDAQAIRRNVAAGQPDGVTAFSGGEWWKFLVAGDDLDLDAYLRGLCGQLRRHFPYAGVQQFRFLDRHALRAVAQCCGSIVGRKALMGAIQKSRDAMQVAVDDFFPEIDRQALVDEIIERFRPLGGAGATFKQLAERLDDLAWDQEAVDQALAFLAESGHASWSDRRAMAGHSYRLFSFRPWPAGLAWDGVTRVAPGRPARTPVTTCR